MKYTLESIEKRKDIDAQFEVAAEQSEEKRRPDQIILISRRESWFDRPTRTNPALDHITGRWNTEAISIITILFRLIGPTFCLF